MQTESPTRVFMFPLAQLAAALALGVPLPRIITLPATATIAVGFCSLIGIVCVLVRSRRRRLATVLISLAFMLTGATLGTIENQAGAGNRLKYFLEAREILESQPVELTGVLIDEPEIARERRYLNLRVERVRTNGFDSGASGVVALLVILPRDSSLRAFEELDLHYGARVEVMTQLKRSDEFRNPGVSTFTEYLDRKGYDASALIKSPVLIKHVNNQAVFQPLAEIYGWRAALQQQFDSRLSSEAAGVLDASLLGNRFNLSHSAAEHFRLGGTFHVLVISGLHITFLGSLIFIIARKFTRNRFTQFLTAATAVWMYSLAVGAEASVVRAALMFTVVLLAPLTWRRAASLNALGGVAIVLLVWKPSDLFDPSFQLTFMSVLAIVAFAWPLIDKLMQIGSWRPTRDTPYPPICPRWFRAVCECLFWSEEKHKRELQLVGHSYRLFKTPFAASLERAHVQSLLRYVFTAVVVSAGVQVVLMPLLVVYFHRLSLSSLFLNITVNLLMAAVTFTALAGVAIAQVSAGLAAPLFQAANGLTWLMIHSVDPFQTLRVLSLRIPEYSGWAGALYVFYYVPLTLLSVFLFRWQPMRPSKINARTKTDRWKLLLALQLCAVGLLIFHPKSAVGARGKLRIDFLDVGQGDSALITLPDDTTVLIDGGGKPGPFNKLAADGEESFERESRSIGEAVVSEYLWWRGLDHVDFLIATHADADHIDGLNDIVRNFSVRAAFAGRMPTHDSEYSRFSQSLSSMGVASRQIGAGDELIFGGVTMKVLWPTPSSNLDLPSGNNDSVVLRLQFGERSMLLTGDIEEPAEKFLLAESEQLRSDLKVDVVKVAHHGSKSSSSEGFVRATQPSIAVVSVGRTSVFGHPNPGVIDRWKAAGAQVLTTGNSGTITLTTDGHDLNLVSYINP